MRVLLKLIFAGLVVHAVWRSGSQYLVYYQFRDGLREAAQFGAEKTEHQLRARALEIAAELKIPVEPEQVSIRREGEHIFIDASYSTQIEILPTYRYPWDFKASVDAWSVAVPKPAEGAVR